MTTDIRLEVSVDDQTLTMWRGETPLAVYPVSTAEKGVGFTDGSLRTPTGRFRVCGKIGAGLPLGTIFRARQPQGTWRPGEMTDEDLILTRIFLLDGLDPDNANTLQRHIYLHGTNREDLIGTPASHGCVRLTNHDIRELFEQVPEGAPLVIHPPARPRGKLFFIDCDSTLSAIEGIDELARARGDDIFAEVAALTDAAMNGEIPIESVFGRRMELIRPDAAACYTVAALYREHLVPGMAALIDALHVRGWLPVILSGGFAPLIAPLAADLGIRHIEAVPLTIDADGTYAGYGADYPTTRAGGKNVIIREWRAAMLPERVVMMGDGASDLETKPDVDLFIGFGGVVAREKVRDGADIWLAEMPAPTLLLDMLEAGSRT
ncbi:MAG: HAD-IB family phosphatase [Akkermansiaceae bacterium]|jgi:phosphoserine phosphatase|nr:HAD-IB family phosphatase [Akkermansiaceae bacterium]